MKMINKFFPIILLLSIAYSCSTAQRDPAQIKVNKQTREECMKDIRPEYNSYFDQYERCAQP